MAGQQSEHQRTQYIALVRGVAAAARQRATRHPALEHAGGGQELGEEHQRAVRSGRRTLVPAHVHAPTQRVDHLRLGRLIAKRSARRQRLASCFTHRVSVPRPATAAPALAQRAISGGELPDLGSALRGTAWPATSSSTTRAGRASHMPDARRTGSPSARCRRCRLQRRSSWSGALQVECEGDGFGAAHALAFCMQSFDLGGRQARRQAGRQCGAVGRFVGLALELAMALVFAV